MSNCSLTDMKEMLEFTPIKSVYNKHDAMLEETLKSLGRAVGDEFAVPAYKALQTIETGIAAQIAGLFSFAVACTGEIPQTTGMVVDTLEGIIKGMATGMLKNQAILEDAVEQPKALHSKEAAAETAKIIDLFKHKE